MKLQTKQYKPTQTAHKNLVEISNILINGIYRLESKEREQNRDNSVDSISLQSVHDSSNNTKVHLKIAISR